MMRFETSVKKNKTSVNTWYMKKSTYQKNIKE